jgi:N utilization substance protein A
MMNKDLIYVVEQIGREKGIGKEVLFEALESALLSASKKTMGAADNVRMQIDRQTGTLRVFARKKVVAAVTDPKLEITLPEARRLNAEAQLEDEIEQELAPQEFGRIAAQTAKQVILQRVRDAERDAVYAEFIDREGKIVRGAVHRIEKRNVIVELGKAEAVITEREQLPGERYNPGDRLRAYMLEVKKTAKGPQILLSRTHPGFLVRLFETEIPEIAEGIVLVKAAAREPGERAKVAVSSTKRDVDPIGACVGLRGTRIQVISRELRGEKIDIVEWSPDPAVFVARALSPAKVSSVTVEQRPEGEEGDDLRSVLVVVPDNQLSLAIGKKGQNVRLASQLTNWRIDIHSETKMREAEERARASLGAIEGATPEMLEGLLRSGWGSAEAVARANADELVALPGVGNAEAAARLIAAAGRAAAVEEKRRAEDKAHAEPVASEAPEVVAERT